MKAFSIGKQEALAVVNLQSKVHASVLKQLKIEVSKRGLRSFLTHEAIDFQSTAKEENCLPLLFASLVELCRLQVLIFQFVRDPSYS